MQMQVVELLMGPRYRSLCILAVAGTLSIMPA